jgi:hypothetical protein
MIAVGERGWTKSMNADYESFKVRVRNELPVLRAMGIKAADESEWDPSKKIRLQATWGHFKKNLSPEMLMVTFFPNKEED